MAIREIHLPDGTNIKIDEWVHYPMFSTIEFAAFTKINLNAFSYTVGNQVPSEGLTKRAATESDTNVPIRGRTGHDEAMVVYAITYEVFGLSNADADPSVAPAGATVLASEAPGYSRHNLLALQRSLLIELLVGAGISKPQVRVPFSRLAQSIGPVIHGTTLATLGAGPALTLGATDAATGGRVSANNQWRLEIPVYIEADRVYKLSVKSMERLTDMNCNTRLRFYLDGMKRRPVA